MASCTFYCWVYPALYIITMDCVACDGFKSLNQLRINVSSDLERSDDGQYDSIKEDDRDQAGNGSTEVIIMHDQLSATPAYFFC